MKASETSKEMHSKILLLMRFFFLRCECCGCTFQNEWKNAQIQYLKVNFPITHTQQRTKLVNKNSTRPHCSSTRRKRENSWTSSQRHYNPRPVTPPGPERTRVVSKTFGEWRVYPAKLCGVEQNSQIVVNNGGGAFSESTTSKQPCADFSPYRLGSRMRRRGLKLSQ